MGLAQVRARLSLDQSLARMGLDYVDIFYSHRFDPETPLEETMGALDTAVRSGQGRCYVGHLVLRSPDRTQRGLWRSCAGHWARPLLIHQPSYSLLNRWIEGELLGVLEAEGVGAIAFSPLAQGLLTDRYLDGIPEDSRVKRSDSSMRVWVSPENLERVRALNAIATERGQTLAQMAIAWTLRDPRVTSALIGASSVAQLNDSLGALENLDFDDGELAEIDRHAVEAEINIWAESSAG